METSCDQLKDLGDWTSRLILDRYAIHATEHLRATQPSTAQYLTVPASTAPIGGTTSFWGTLEYRRPLVKNIQPGSYREIEAIQGGLFLDLGVLDPDEFSLDFQELRVSTGFLFGISFPVPLTFSFGFPLREEDGDDTQIFEFEIGF